jgi:putative hydrolase of HD superfamily
MKEITNFFYELGQLKRVKRSGWWLAGIKHPESVAEHAFRAATIGFVLAKLEGANPEKTALICLFHELPETRLNDFHKVIQRYIDIKTVEEKVLKEQLSTLPKEIAEELSNFLKDYGKDGTKEQIVAKDADYLEGCLQAKEYIEQGHKNAQIWIDNTKKGCLKTETAKKMLELIEKTNSSEWHKALQNIKR